MTIAVKLILSFLLVISIVSLVFIIAGIRLINNRVVSEAQEKVRLDLNAARIIFSDKLEEVGNTIRITADRSFIKDAILTGAIDDIAGTIQSIRIREGLDILSITDRNGKVIFRANNLRLIGDDQSSDPFISQVLIENKVVAAPCIILLSELQMESSILAEQTYFKFIDTPMARLRPETEERNGMMLKAAAPILDYDNHFIGIVYGGILLNRNYEIVDKIKQTVFQDVKYKGKDIGTATIFQDDLRISTNVMNVDGTRAIGTRVAEQVYNQVVLKGTPWIGRAFVVNDWYISAYEPIHDLGGKIIGILYVGILEQRYTDIKSETVLVFLAITLSGALGMLAFSYHVSRIFSKSINKLTFASREIAQGNLNVKVDVKSNDEFEELADAFNLMSTALKDRDERIKEFTTKKIMESERLALIGQLAAGVAHELNNPLQGIVAFSHLLLEKTSEDDPRRNSIQKIVSQADRSRDIIRGLLDFSRQRKPDKTVCNINSILENCISLVENQAIFHDIQVVKNLEDGLPLITIDPSQVERVFIKMIINASQAMEKGGQLTLATCLDSGKKNIVITISDTGMGISPENLEKIFDPFFTTRAENTGLGLSIVYKIVREHGGSITVRSAGRGKGSTFTLKFPIES